MARLETFPEVCGAIKRALDPHGILAPGRYDIGRDRAGRSGLCRSQVTVIRSPASLTHVRCRPEEVTRGALATRQRGPRAKHPIHFDHRVQQVVPSSAHARVRSDRRTDEASTRQVPDQRAEARFRKRPQVSNG